jgi:AcrR family transcriptional regulator
MSTRNRTYDNTRREEQAAATRRRIIATADKMLLEGSYASMTINALAEAARVSVQTVYNAIGGKAAVVKAVYDVRLAGDDQAIPMSERPEFLRIAQAPSFAEGLARYAALSRLIYERVGALLGVLLAHGAGNDVVLAELVATTEQERRIGNGHAVDALIERFGLPAGLEREAVVDVVWALTAPEVAERLVVRCRWPLADYERWLATALATALVPYSESVPSPQATKRRRRTSPGG